MCESAVREEREEKGGNKKETHTFLTKDSETRETDILLRFSLSICSVFFGRVKIVLNLILRN